MTGSEGCSINDLLCRPCHFLRLSTGTSIYCEMKHELSLWTLTYLWKTQKMHLERTLRMRVCFSARKRGDISARQQRQWAQSNFDLLTMRGAMPVSLGRLILMIPATLGSQYYYFSLKSGQTGTQKYYMPHPKSLSWCVVWQHQKSDLSASSSRGFLHELLLSCASFSATRISYFLVRQLPDSIPGWTKPPDEAQTHKEVAVFLKQLLSLSASVLENVCPEWINQHSHY